eukprot:6852876-Heterocapsa_arctica.AAC.1
MGRLVRLRVSAGIEQLCKDVYFEKSEGNYAGWNESTINSTLNKYKSHYASETGNQELNAIIRLSLI